MARCHGTANYLAPVDAMTQAGGGAWSRPLRCWVGAAAMVTVLLRLPFLTTPLNVDEGGYATIAWQWASGAQLYRDVWVDRPQGLLVFYRLVFAAFGPHAWAVRAVAALWAVVGVVAVAEVARVRRGPRAAALAAMVFAVLSATPRAEGFAANGELLAAVPSVACVALVLGARTARAGRAPRVIRLGSSGRLVAAGICGAAAVLLKQSGFDGAVAVVGLLLASGALRRESRADAARALALLAAGAAIVAIPAILHGMSLGWGDWWFAVVGQRSGSQSVWTGNLTTRLERLRILVTTLAPVLVATLLVLVAAPAARAGCWLVSSVRRSSAAPTSAGSAGSAATAAAVPNGGPALATLEDRVLIGGWVAASLAGFVLGGLFHPHYLIGLVPVVAVLAGCSLAVAWDRATSVAALAGGLGVVLYAVSAWPAMTAGQSDVRSMRSTADHRVVSDAEVAAYLRAHTTEQDSIYAMYANAGLYFAADRRPASPYLWWLNLVQVPGAIDQLAEVFNGPDAPRYVARYSEADALPGDDAVKIAFERRYRLETVVAGVQLFRLIEDTEPPPAKPLTSSSVLSADST